MGFGSTKSNIRSKKVSNSLEERVGQLENDLIKTRKIVHKLVVALEEQLAKDIDDDGQIG